MARGFNLTAEINLRGPSNVRNVVADIRRQLGTIDTAVTVRIDPQAANNATRLTTVLNRLNNTLTTTSTQSRATAANISQLANALGSFQTSANAAARSLNGLPRNIAQTTQNIQRAAQQTATARTEIEEFGRQSALAVRRFAAFSLATGAIYSLVNAVSKATKEFIEFDKQVVRLTQITGESYETLGGLTSTITRLSTSLGVASQDLIGVADTLAQAGLSARETDEALKALALSAVAPSFDKLSDTVEGAIALMRQFSISTGELEKALSSINSVAAAFAVESSDLITAIQRTGGVFASASKGVSEGTDALNEFLAIFTSVRATTRESAETIATGLRTIFTRIQRGDTIEALKDYGVVLTDVEGKFVGAYKAIELLAQGLGRLDPRDLKFSQIVEELGGFRQIGKVLPLIQQFATAQDALKVAYNGQGSLAADAVKAQASLAIQFAKTREEFVALIRDIGNSDSFRSLVSVGLTLANTFIKVASVAKPLLPILTSIAAVKGAEALFQFGSGFIGGFGRQSASSVGQNAGQVLSGARNQQNAAQVVNNTRVLTTNTTAIQSLTSAVQQLNNTISNRRGAGPQTINSGGVVRAFARGGFVPGVGNSDTVPAMLMPGEFVIRKKAVETIGADTLQKMNKYGNGGNVRAGLSSKRSRFALGGKARIADISDIEVTDGDTFTATITPTSDPFSAKFRAWNYDAYETGNKNSRVSSTRLEQIKKIPSNKNKSFARTDSGYLVEPETRVYGNLTAAGAARDATTEFNTKVRSQLTSSKADFINKLNSNLDDDGGFGRYKADLGFVLDDRLTTGRFQNKYLGGLIQRFARGGMSGLRQVASRRVGIIDTDVLRDPANKDVVSAEMEKLGLTDTSAYTIELAKRAASARKAGSLLRLRAIAGAAGSGKSSLATGLGANDNARLRQTTRSQILTPQDIANVDEVLVLTSTASDSKLDGYLRDVDRAYVLSSSSLEERQQVESNRERRDATGQGLYGRKPGTTRGATTDFALDETILRDELGSRAVVLGRRAGSYGVRRKREEELPEIIQAGGFYTGGFAPPTRGHRGALNSLLARMMKQNPGASIEDIVVSVAPDLPMVAGSEGIEHAARYGIFPTDFRALLARTNFGGAMISTQDQPPGSLPKFMEVAGSEGRRRFARLRGAMAVTSGKEEGVLGKYERAGIQVEDIPRIEDISATKVRDALFQGDDRLLQEYLDPEIASVLMGNRAQLRNRAVMVPMLLEKIKEVVEVEKTNTNAEIEQLLASAPGGPYKNVSAKLRENAPEVAEQVKQIRSQRDSMARGAFGYRAYGVIRELAAQYPEIYGLDPNRKAAVSAAAQDISRETMLGQVTESMRGSFPSLDAVSQVSPIQQALLERVQKQTATRGSGVLPASNDVILKELGSYVLPSEPQFGVFGGKPIAQHLRLGKKAKTRLPYWFTGDYKSLLKRPGDISGLTPEDVAAYAATRDHIIGVYNQQKSGVQNDLLESSAQQVAQSQMLAIVGLRGKNGIQGPLTWNLGNNAAGEPVSMSATILEKVLPAKYKNVADYINEQTSSIVQGAANMLTGQDTAKGLDAKKREVLNQGNIEGGILEQLLATLGAEVLDDAARTRAIDFPSGIGETAAKIFGIDANIPTEAKRTIDATSRAKAMEEFQRYFRGVYGIAEPSADLVQNFAKGGKVDDLLVKYKDIIKSIMPPEYLTKDGLLRTPSGEAYNVGITQKRTPMAMIAAMLGSQGTAGYYGLADNLIKNRLEQNKNKFNPEDYQKLSNYVQSRLAGPSVIDIPIGRENQLSHESFHAIQNYLLDNYPDIYTKLQDSAGKREKQFIDIYKSSPINKRYPLKSILPSSGDEAAYRSSLAGFASLRTTMPKSKDAISSVTDQSAIDLSRNEIIPLLISAAREFNDKKAESLLSDIFAEAGLNKNFAATMPQGYFWGGKVDPLAKKYGLSQSEFEEQKKIAKFMGLSDQDFEEKLRLFATQKGRVKGAKFAALDAIADTSVANQNVMAQQKALEEFLATTKFAEGGTAVADKPQKDYGRISITEDYPQISVGYIKNDTRSGYASAYKMRDYLYYVGLSNATSGYGPRLYDILMEAVTEKGAMLTSDRSSVSGDARRVWEYYFKNRGDVKKTPLKPDDWTKNQALIDPKLYGREETWPPATDPAWVLQSGYSKSPDLINGPNVSRGKAAVDSRTMASSFFANSTARFAQGGSAEDTVPALLTPGEFVINKKAAQRIGYGKLQKLNHADKIQGFNKGGFVGVQKFANGGTPSTPEQLDQIDKAISDALRSLPDAIRDAIIDFRTTMVSDSQQFKLSDTFDQINLKLRQQLVLAQKNIDTLGPDVVEGIRKALGAGVKQAYRIENQVKPEDYYSKLDYSDVRGSPGNIRDSGRRYAEALSGQDPLAIEALVSKIRKEMEAATQALGIPISAAGRSQSWAYWDVGKQLYMQQNPTQSNTDKYRLANPLTDSQIQKEIIQRQIGYEISRKDREGRAIGAEGQLLSSADLKDLGSRVMEQIDATKAQTEAIKAQTEAQQQLFPFMSGGSSGPSGPTLPNGQTTFPFMSNILNPYTATLPSGIRYNPVSRNIRRNTRENDPNIQSRYRDVASLRFNRAIEQTANRAAALGAALSVPLETLSRFAGSTTVAGKTLSSLSQSAASLSATFYQALQGIRAVANFADSRFGQRILGQLSQSLNTAGLGRFFNQQRNLFGNTSSFAQFGTGVAAGAAAAVALTQAFVDYSNALKESKIEDAQKRQEEALTKSAEALEKYAKSQDAASLAMANTFATSAASAALDEANARIEGERRFGVKTGASVGAGAIAGGVIGQAVIPIPVLGAAIGAAIGGTLTGTLAQYLNFDRQRGITAEESARGLGQSRSRLNEVFAQRFTSGETSEDIMASPDWARQSELLARSNASIEAIIRAVDADVSLSEDTRKARIAELIQLEASAQLREQEQIWLKQKGLIDLDNATKAYSRSLRNMFANMDEAINRTSVILENFSASVELAQASLNGQARIGLSRNENLNIIRNPRASSIEERAVAADAAGSFFGSERGTVSELLNVGPRIESAVLAAVQAAQTLPGTTTDEAISIAIRRSVRDELTGSSLPQELSDKLGQQIAAEIERRRKTGDDKVDFRELEEAIPQLKDSVDALKGAQDIAIKALEDYTQKVSTFIEQTNTSVELLVQASELLRKASDIRFSAQQQLNRALGSGSDLDALRGFRDSTIRNQTGGATSPQAIAANINRLENRRAFQQNQLQTATQSGRSGVRDVLGFTNELSRTTRSLRENQKALEDLASNSEAASMALEKISEVQARTQSGQNIIERYITSTRSDNFKLSAAFERLDNNMRGLVNDPMASRNVFEAMRDSDNPLLAAEQAAAQDRRDTLEAFNMIAPLLGDTREQNALRANMLEAMLQESGVGMTPMFNEVLKSLRDPQSNSEMAQLVQKYTESIRIQAQANDQLAQLNSNFANNIKVNSEEAFINAINATLIEFERAQTEHLSKIEEILSKQQGKPVGGMAKGGIVYKETGGTIFQSQGTDTVPAMLTPGEFVVNRASTQRYGSVLKAINANKYSDGGPVRYYNKGGYVSPLLKEQRDFTSTASVADGYGANDYQPEKGPFSKNRHYAPKDIEEILLTGPSSSKVSIVTLSDNASIIPSALMPIGPDKFPVSDIWSPSIGEHNKQFRKFITSGVTATSVALGSYPEYSFGAIRLSPRVWTADAQDIEASTIGAFPQSLLLNTTKSKLDSKKRFLRESDIQDEALMEKIQTELESAKAVLSRQDLSIYDKTNFNNLLANQATEWNSRGKTVSNDFAPKANLNNISIKDISQGGKQPAFIVGASPGGSATSVSPVLKYPLSDMNTVGKAAGLSTNDMQIVSGFVNKLDLGAGGFTVDASAKSREKPKVSVFSPEVLFAAQASDNSLNYMGNLSAIVEDFNSISDDVFGPETIYSNRFNIYEQTLQNISKGLIEKAKFDKNIVDLTRLDSLNSISGNKIKNDKFAQLYVWSKRAFDPNQVKSNNRFKNATNIGVDFPIRENKTGISTNYVWSLSDAITGSSFIDSIKPFMDPKQYLVNETFTGTFDAPWAKDKKLNVEFPYKLLKKLPIYDFATEEMNQEYSGFGLYSDTFTRSPGDDILNPFKLATQDYNSPGLILAKGDVQNILSDKIKAWIISNNGQTPTKAVNLGGLDKLLQIKPSELDIVPEDNDLSRETAVARTDILGKNGSFYQQLANIGVLYSKSSDGVDFSDLDLDPSMLNNFKSRMELDKAFEAKVTDQRLPAFSNGILQVKNELVKSKESLLQDFIDRSDISDFNLSDLAPWVKNLQDSRIGDLFNNGIAVPNNLRQVYLQTLNWDKTQRTADLMNATEGQYPGAFQELMSLLQLAFYVNGGKTPSATAALSKEFTDLQQGFFGGQNLDALSVFEDSKVAGKRGKQWWKAIGPDWGGFAEYNRSIISRKEMVSNLKNIINRASQASFNQQDAQDLAEGIDVMSIVGGQAQVQSESAANNLAELMLKAIDTTKTYTEGYRFDVANAVQKFTAPDMDQLELNRLKAMMDPNGDLINYLSFKDAMFGRPISNVQGIKVQGDDRDIKAPRLANYVPNADYVNGFNPWDIYETFLDNAKFTGISNAFNEIVGVVGSMSDTARSFVLQNPRSLYDGPSQTFDGKPYVDPAHRSADPMNGSGSYVTAYKALAGTMYSTLFDRARDEGNTLEDSTVENRNVIYRAKGGQVGYYADGGSIINFQPKGTDKVPAMLTPGEFVVNRQATQRNLPLLKALNSQNYQTGGLVKYLQRGSAKPIEPTNSRSIFRQFLDAIRSNSDEDILTMGNPNASLSLSRIKQFVWDMTVGGWSGFGGDIPRGKIVGPVNRSSTATAATAGASYDRKIPSLKWDRDVAETRWELSSRAEASRRARESYKPPVLAEDPTAYSPSSRAQASRQARESYKPTSSPEAYIDTADAIAASAEFEKEYKLRKQNILKRELMLEEGPLSSINLATPSMTFESWTKKNKTDGKILAYDAARSFLAILKTAGTDILEPNKTTDGVTAFPMNLLSPASQDSVLSLLQNRELSLDDPYPYQKVGINEAIVRLEKKYGKEFVKDYRSPNRVSYVNYPKAGPLPDPNQGYIASKLSNFLVASILDKQKRFPAPTAEAMPEEETRTAYTSRPVEDNQSRFPQQTSTPAPINDEIAVFGQEFRKWLDVSERYSMVGKLIGFLRANQNAKLLTRQNKNLSIPINKFSKFDQDYLRRVQSGAYTAKTSTNNQQTKPSEQQPINQQNVQNIDRLWYGGKLWDLNNDGVAAEKIFGRINRILDAQRVLIDTNSVSGGQLILRKEYMTKEDLDLVTAWDNQRKIKPISRQFGGTVYASEGQYINFQPKGTDTVPAMLTPGEFVVNRQATAKNLPLLQSINRGSAKPYSQGGVVYLAGGGMASFESALELAKVFKAGVSASSDIEFFDSSKLLGVGSDIGDVVTGLADLSGRLSGVGSQVNAAAGFIGNQFGAIQGIINLSKADNWNDRFKALGELTSGTLKSSADVLKLQSSAGQTASGGIRLGAGASGNLAGNLIKGAAIATILFDTFSGWTNRSGSWTSDIVGRSGDALSGAFTGSANSGGSIIAGMTGIQIGSNTDETLSGLGAAGRGAILGGTIAGPPGAAVGAVVGASAEVLKITGETLDYINKTNERTRELSSGWYESQMKAMQRGEIDQVDIFSTGTRGNRRRKEYTDGDLIDWINPAAYGDAIGAALTREESLGEKALQGKLTDKERELLNIINAANYISRKSTSILGASSAAGNVLAHGHIAYLLSEAQAKKEQKTNAQGFARGGLVSELSGLYQRRLTEQKELAAANDQWFVVPLKADRARGSQAGDTRTIFDNSGNTLPASELLTLDDAKLAVLYGRDSKVLNKEAATKYPWFDKTKHRLVMGKGIYQSQKTAFNKQDPALKLIDELAYEYKTMPNIFESKNKNAYTDENVDKAKFISSLQDKSGKFIPDKTKEASELLKNRNNFLTTLFFNLEEALDIVDAYLRDNGRDNTLRSAFGDSDPDNILQIQKGAVGKELENIDQLLKEAEISKYAQNVKNKFNASRILDFSQTQNLASIINKFAGSRRQEPVQPPTSPVAMATGGSVPRYLTSGALVDFSPRGTDTVPAMLTPGEFVVNKKATQNNLPLLKQINSQSYQRGGVVRYYQQGSRSPIQAAGGSVGMYSLSLDDKSISLIREFSSRFAQFSNNLANLTLPSLRIDESTLSSLNDFTKRFDNFTKELLKVSIPPVITITGKHEVNVNINGASVFSSMDKYVSNMIKNEISNAFAQLSRETDGAINMTYNPSSSSNQNSQNMA